ncbi:glucose-fructose oxidoreductase domain-containing protein 1 isoform X2 [Acinonyx jubatus]|uniref:Glucose-fructose oxidoreductase domain-containing protein 1 isoform X2 n=1 Tax=Acinonyx jubatus TaxID=32536 RepID=A0ABM3Q5E6_ACIJB|nr:glucose-fructose oxidoreductase domain-containing protein 1 isoform X2 [Acinonyx jubatus]
MGEYIFGNKPVYTEKSGGPAGLGFSRENQVFFLQTRLKGMGSVPRKPAGDISLGFLCAHWMPLPLLERPNGGPSKERACLLSWQPWPSPQTASPWGFSGIGKNVICDRTATPLDAFRMMSAAHYYPKLMSIMGNVLRFLPAFVRMKQLIEEGYVGELLVCEVQVHGGSLLGKKYNWSCDDLMGGGGLHSVGTYIIDLLTFLTGQKAVKVHGLLKTFVKQTDHIKGIRQITSDDFCTFQMVLEGGVCCTVTLNFNVPGEFKQDVTVVGSAGRLLAVGTDLYGQRNSAPEQELLLQDATPVSNSLLPEKAFSDIPAPYLRGTIKMMQAVRQAFQDQDDRRTWDGRPLTMAATFDDCLYALCVVDTIKRSSQTGEWQNIAIMTEEPELSPAYLISEAMRRSRMSLYC